MKNPRAAGLVALFLLTLITPRFATAQPTVSGKFRFILDGDDPIKSVEVDVKGDERGGASGQLTFTDPSRIPDADDPEDPRSADAPAELFIQASVDTLTVEKNRAVMNGVVRESSHKSYLGRWVQLVIEDNGDNLRVPDQLTWSFCQPPASGWIPSDAERKDDDGAFLSWWATDAERSDDVGIPSRPAFGSDNKVTGCQVLPLSSYTLAFPAKWEGDIIVRP